MVDWRQDKDAPPIRFVRVGKSYGSGESARPIFSEFSLECPGAQVTTIVGASGCGKTTLLNLAAGLIRPDSGAVYVGSEEVTEPGPDRGVVFQQYALFPWLSVAENVGFGLARKGVPKRERERIICDYLTLVGLQDHGHVLPKALSGGMKQRCALARALAVRPKVLLMDEPFGALDAITRQRLQTELLDIVGRERQTTLFITHDIDEAAFLSHRIVVMRSNPARVVDIVDVPYGFPRGDAARAHPDFLSIRHRLWSQLSGD